MDDSGSASLPAWRDAIEQRLSELTPEQEGPAAPLANCARYALLAPGKRLRPLLTLAASAQFGADPLLALDPACAFEMVHAASLILDDLPCMDDAALRRGRPAAHLAYGQDVAILAAVALLGRAFGVIAGAEALPPEARTALVVRLSDAVGFDGLTAGQTRDLRERAAVTQSAALERLNHQKTGVLFALAAEAGARCATGDGRAADAASAFGTRLGSAFQVLDDLLDVEGDVAVAGKDVGQDGGKPTFVSLLGPDGARRRIEAELDAGAAALRALTPRGPLDSLAASVFPARSEAPA